MKIYHIFRKVSTLHPLLNKVSRRRHCKKTMRCLEIGPGSAPLQGFETLNICWTGVEDYVCNAAEPLPFADREFDIVYASHVLEHIPWYHSVKVLKEWLRVLKPGGWLELWVPDGLKICKTLIDYECEGRNGIDQDGWYRYNENRDPALWASGRIFTYGDGTGEPSHPNWHRALFTPRLLEKLLEDAGFSSINILNRSQVRGYDHGWINLGYGAKKSAKYGNDL